jgi:hypothetical protein
MRAHRVASCAGNSAEGRRVARPTGLNVFLDQCPGRLDGIEVMRVGRQILHRCPDAFDGPPYGRLFVRAEIVQHHDGAPPQPRDECAPDPPEERLRVDGAPAGAEGHPSPPTDGADQGQVVAPIHRSRLDILAAPQDPRVRPTHREIRPGFIDEDQALRIDATHPSQEPGALRLDVRPIDLARPRPFFLSTYPSRCIARRKLVSVVRAAAGARRLYSQHSSATVASGAAAITACSSGRSIGHRQPPAFGFGTNDPVARSCAIHRCNVRGSIENVAAISSNVPSPRRYARTARSRRSTPYAFAIPRVKYTRHGDSSAFRG